MLRGDELIHEILVAEDHDATNNLLKERFRGYPVLGIRRLLRDDKITP